MVPKIGRSTFQIGIDHVPPIGWKRVPADAGQGFSERFEPSIAHREGGVNLPGIDGQRITLRRISEVGKAIRKVLRHDWTLQVNLPGLAWLTDAQQRVCDDEEWFPTEGDN